MREDKAQMKAKLYSLLSVNPNMTYEVRGSDDKYYVIQLYKNQDAGIAAY